MVKYDWRSQFLSHPDHVGALSYTQTGPMEGRIMTNSALQQIISKSRDAKEGGFGVLSTGEKLAAALVLNRPDWLASMNYTLAEAIERVGMDWLALIPEAARVLEYEAEKAAGEA